MHTHRHWAVAVVALLVLAACGGVESKRAPELHWYTTPDRVDLSAIARACTDESGGRFQISVTELPADVDDRRAEVIRRLRAGDDGIDILSVDTAFTAELGASGLLRPVPKERAAAFGEGVYPHALAASTYDGALVTVPWWYDPQLLWYRGTAAERAGLDTTKPITWDDLLTGAERIGATVQIDGDGGAGLAAWVNALLGGSDAALVSGPGRSAKLALDTPAGRRAASIVEFYAQSELGEGPADDAIRRFAGPGGAFLLAPASAIADPAMAPVQADLAWTSYPVVAGEGGAPLAGVGLGVPRSGKHAALAFDAIECLTSPTVSSALMASSGHNAARATLLEDEEVKDSYRLADLVPGAVESGVPEPQTPYWHLVRRGIDQTWLPLDGVRAGSTPGDSQKRVARLLSGAIG